jgi:sRNA-binding regulator protein Hfq
MFEKLKLRKKIKQYRKMIEDAEKKRIRSQAALVEAILTNSVPSDEDVDYFNKYTAVINNFRDQMRVYQNQLSGMSGNDDK